jgi:U1 zinc finger
MSEYWKSTPKYWCKHCSVYVRDTKLERANHESTAKHQSALKRFLRDLHRDHEKEERGKETARREVERLNGVVSGSSKTSMLSNRTTGGSPAAGTAADRKRQMEQLVEMGVLIPTEFRGDMAMPGEWTVTSTRVIGDNTGEEEAKSDIPLDAKATGVRKREQTEEEKEEEEAVRGLFKRPRKWGKDTKVISSEGDGGLDALLNGTVLPPKGAHGQDKALNNDQDEQTDIKNDGAENLAVAGKSAEHDTKQEPDGEESGGGLYTGASRIAEVSALKTEKTRAETASIIFKKRKPRKI